MPKKSLSLEGGVLFGNGTLPLFSGSHLLSTGYFYSFKAAGGGGGEAWGVLSAAIFPWLKSFFFSKCQKQLTN